MKILERDTSKLEKVATPLPRISYDDAIEFLKAEGFDDIEWGEDFGAPHETAIANHYDLPVFITNYPTKVSLSICNQILRMKKLSYVQT